MEPVFRPVRPVGPRRRNRAGAALSLCAQTRPVIGQPGRHTGRLAIRLYRSIPENLPHTRQRDGQAAEPRSRRPTHHGGILHTRRRGSPGGIADRRTAARARAVRQARFAGGALFRGVDLRNAFALARQDATGRGRSRTKGFHCRGPVGGSGPRRTAHPPRRGQDH